MTNTTRALPLALAAAAVLTVPACGVTIGTTATPITAPAAAPTMQPAVVDAPEEDLSLEGAAELIRPFLLTADEVGPGFSPADEPQPDASTPAICGGPNTVAEFPTAVRVGAKFAGPVEGVQGHRDGVGLRGRRHRAGRVPGRCGRHGLRRGRRGR